MAAMTPWFVTHGGLKPFPANPNTNGILCVAGIASAIGASGVTPASIGWAFVAAGANPACGLTGYPPGSYSTTAAGAGGTTVIITQTIGLPGSGNDSISIRVIQPDGSYKETKYNDDGSKTQSSGQMADAGTSDGSGYQVAYDCTSDGEYAAYDGESDGLDGIPADGSGDTGGDTGGDMGPGDAWG